MLASPTARKSSPDFGDFVRTLEPQGEAHGKDEITFSCTKCAAKTVEWTWVARSYSREDPKADRKRSSRKP